MLLFFASLGNKGDSYVPVRVACIGDSITEDSGYPSKLQSKLGTGYMVRNFGVSGATVIAQSGNPYANLYASQDAKKFLPEIVVIMLGTNDARSIALPFLGNFAAEYKNLISEFQGLTSKPEILLVEPPPIFANHLGLNNTILVQDVIPRIEQVANESGLPTIDVYAALINHPEYFLDGVHPNSKGAEVIATEVNNGITLINSTKAFAMKTTQTECNLNPMEIILRKQV